MTVTRYPNGVAIGGSSSRASSAGLIGAMRFSFDPTSSAQVLLGYLPEGAVPIDVVGYGGATGGSSPTVDIGISGTSDGMANELSASAAGASALASAKAGTLLNTRLTALTPIYGKVGASAAAGGTFKGAVLYTIEDV